MNVLAILVIIFFGLSCLTLIPARETNADGLVALFFVCCVTTMALGFSLAIKVLS